MARSVSHDVVSDLYLSSDRRLSNVVGGQAAEDIANLVSKEELNGERSSMRKSILKSITSNEDDENDIEEALFPKDNFIPDMWSWNFIGLYSQYAAVGLLYGSSGTLLPFCVYTFDGATNVCSNAKNIVLFAWSFKIVFAVITDSYRPFGMRRKPWMIFGWTFVLALLLVLAFAADKMSVSVWLVTLLFVQGFLMLSDVPAGKKS